MKMKKTGMLIGAIALMLGTGIVQSATEDSIPSHSAAEALANGKLALEQDPTLDSIPGQVLVRFTSNDERIKSAARSLVAGQLLRTFRGVDRLEHLEVGIPVDRAIEMLNALPFVEYAEPNYVVHAIAQPNDNFIGLQWGVNNTGQSIRGVTGIADADIDGFEAWDIRTSAAGVIVAVIDTGTQWDHPDLDANIWSNSGEIPGNGIDDDNNGFIDDIRGWDFFSNDNNPTDEEGHGTHTAGTVGAEGNNSIGVAGVAWDVQIMPLRFLGPNGGSTSDAIAALNYAVANGARISNNSWGGGGFSSAMRDAIANAGAQNHLFVAAAGNDGTNNDSLSFYPASYTEDSIISVAAIDNRDQIASFSNFGLVSVDLGAPGVDIASTYIGDGYVWNSGTSMASPHVAGAAAILLAQNPGWSNAQLRTRLLTTTRATSAMSTTTATGGVLNLAAALAGGPANTPPTATINSPTNGTTVTDGDSVSFVGSASDTEDGDLSASLVWTSDLDGQIGTGASFSTTTLSVGTHTITASVSDSGGLSGSDSISITVDPAPPANTAPTATISSPANGSTVIEGDSVSFAGSASDAEDGDLSASLVWTSDLDGQIGTGASFSTTTLSVGTHVITASVSDSGGLSGNDSITITVDSNQPPATPPAEPGRPRLTNLGGGSVSITWADNSNNETSFEIRREKRVGSSWSNTTTIASVGADVTTYVDNPGSGTWRYSVRAVNSAGGSTWSRWKAISVSATNTAPTATIGSPASGSSFVEGNSVSFTGTASDAEDGDLSAALVWTSNLDGQIGTGASFSTSSLSAGTHTITASVNDSGGLSGNDAISITVDPAPPGNTAPTANISSPTTGTTITEGNSVSFSGSASDAEDGDLSASMVWTSDLDGQIGTGASFSTSALSLGTHTITASVNDSGGLSGSDTVTITIESSVPPTSPPAEPGRPALSNLGGGSVGITWADNSDNETSFEIRREERGANRVWGNTTTVAIVGADITSYTDTPGVGIWRYSVRAVNSTGASNWSRWKAIRIR
jgi:subtilisin family serine protease